MNCPRCGAVIKASDHSVLSPGVVSFLDNKYTLAAINTVLLLAAAISVFMFGTVNKALVLTKNSSPDTADMTISFVCIIMAVLCAAGVLLTVSGIKKDTAKAKLLLLTGTILFTWIHIISAHIVSRSVLVSLSEGTISVSEVKAYCPVFEIVFLCIGIVSVFVYVFSGLLNRTPTAKEDAV